MTGAEITSDTGYFAQVPEWVLDSGVSGNAVKLYAILRRYADYRTLYAHPSRKTLAERMGFSRPASVDPLVRELVDIGAVEVIERWTEHGDRDSNGYRVLSVSPVEVVRESGPRVVGQSGPRVVRESGQQKREPLEREPLEREGDFSLLSVPADSPSCFEEAWASWPNRKSRATAERAWVKATAKLGPSALARLTVQHGQAYAAQVAAGKEMKFVPHLATWLNQERWTDPIDAPVARVDPDAWMQPR